MVDNSISEYIALNKEYSTTRRVVRKTTDNTSSYKPSATVRDVSDLQTEGGIRTRGYLKAGSTSSPLITVVIVVYNGIATVEKAILSVLDQTYDNIELILVDGGSNDGTLDIIRKYDDALNYWVSETDEGVYYAMNKAVSMSHGDYILFLGCDDVLFNVIHEVVDCFDLSYMSYYGDVVFTSNKQSYGGEFDPVKLVHGNVPSQAIFYSRHVFEKHRFNLKYLALADYELNFRVFSDRGFGFKYINKKIALYNDETGLSSTVVDQVFINDFQKIVCKNYSLLNIIKYLYIKYILKNTW